jgi:transcriptional regulator with XRE-family HTH domain
MRYGMMYYMPELDTVPLTVGRNVKALRQQRRMTIDALAAAAGVSRGTVIQIEAARGISTLCNLAAALRVGVTSLVDSEANPRVTVRSAAEATPLWRSTEGSEAIFRIGTDPPDVVELWDWTLLPGERFDGEAHPRGTVEVLLVLAGGLTLVVGETEHSLAVDDTATFEASVGHAYTNRGDVPLRFVMVVVQAGDVGMVPPTQIAPADPADLAD